MNKIISMNHSTFGDITSIEYTALELLDVERKVAQSMQAQPFPHIVEAGWVKEGDVFVALVNLANTDPAHILNAQQEVDWRTEAEAQAADAQDWQDQVTELRGG